MNQELEVYDPHADSGKDYILQVKVKNGPLLRAIRMRGFKNANQFCAASGLSPQVVGKYLSLQNVPLNSKGEWKVSALSLAKYLRLPPDVLFPEQHLDRALAKASGEVEVSRDEVAALIEHNDPDEAESRERLASALVKALSDLTPREEKVLRLRHGFDCEPKTAEEVGKDLGVSGPRIRQIEAKAINRLRSAGLLKPLSEAGYMPAHNALVRRQKQDIEEAAAMARQHYAAAAAKAEEEKRKYEERKRTKALLASLPPLCPSCFNRPFWKLDEVFADCAAVHCTSCFEVFVVEQQADKSAA